MPSKLATSLLGVERPAGEVGDLMWRMADLAGAGEARTPIREDAAKELALFLDKEPAEAFGRLLPESGVLTAVVTAQYNPELWKGAAANPNLTRAALTHMLKTAKGETRTLLEARLARIEGLEDALDRSDTDGALAAFGELARNLDVALVTDVLEARTDEVLALLAQVEDPEVVTKTAEEVEAELDEEEAPEEVKPLDFRGRVLKELGRRDEAAGDSAFDLLAGVLDDSSAAKVVDAWVATWLVDSTSFEAEIARANLAPEGGVKASSEAEEFVGRCNWAAKYVLMRSEALYELVARKRSSAKFNTKRERRVDEGIALDLDQLTTLEMAGALTEDQISAMILSTNVELEVDELVQRIQGANPMRLANFLAGTCVRNVRAGEVAALVAALSVDEREELLKAVDEVSKEAKETLADLPWYDELLVGLPQRFAGPLRKSDAEVLDKAMRERLGEQVEAWETALVLAEGWEGNFLALLEAATRVETE